ncbi:MAG: polyhydroxyalkanoic acid system family protein [Deltaproteobacteria bacterium]|nr:polyhydroxyalkanoic acid system family protein [Deltaproteobacteria bacterium]
MPGLSVARTVKKKDRKAQLFMLRLNPFMADIQFKWKHPYTRAEAKRRIKPSIAETAKSFGLKLQWNGDLCNFEGPAMGHVIVKDDAVEMEANLGFAARLIKSTIERTISEEIDRVLA